MLMRSESLANQSMMEPHMKGNRLTIAAGSDMFSRIEEYEVQNGDTLTQIAFKFKASQRQIRKVNHMLDDTIMPGEKLLIPIID